MSFMTKLLKSSAGKTPLQLQVEQFMASAQSTGNSLRSVGVKLATEQYSVGGNDELALEVNDGVSAALENLRNSLTDRARLVNRDGVAMALENWRVGAAGRMESVSQTEYTPSMLSAVLGTALASAGNYNGNMASRKVSMEALKASVGGVQQFMLADADGFANSSSEVSLVKEAFDAKQNVPGMQERHIAYNQAYNFFAVGQDEALESIYPSIVLAPDQAGVSIEATVMAIWRGAKHTVNTTQADFKKQMLVRARRHPKMLDRESTTVVPHYVTPHEDQFVDVAKFPTYLREVDTVKVPTTFLKPGADRNLLLLSGHPELTKNAVMNEKDGLEPAVMLTRIALYLGDSPLAFSTTNVQGNQFVAAQQGLQPARQLNIRIENMTVNKDTLDITGAALSQKWKDALGDNTVVLGAVVTGQVNTESSFISVGLQNTPFIVTLHDKDKIAIPKGDVRYKKVQDLITIGFNPIEDFGYEQQSYRSNLTLRQAGQLVDRMRFTQLYEVALRAPVSAQCAVSQKDTASPELLTTLLATLRARISGELVTNLMAHMDAVRECYRTPVELGDIPVHLGAGRFSLLPYYNDEELDLSTTQSLDDADRRQNISSRIVTFLKDRVYTAYQQSEFQAAAEQKFGGIAPRPTVVILTDIVTASYINIPGDTRTMGDQFDFRVVTTLDERMDGKIAVVFNYLDGSQNAAINELNFGNLLWSAEVLYSADLTVDGQLFHRMTSQPRYRFINHAPVGMLFTVKGLQAALTNPFRMKSL